MEEDLVVQMERLRHERESLDRERRHLAERAHQIDLMEESYHRLVGTMGVSQLMDFSMSQDKKRLLFGQSHIPVESCSNRQSILLYS